MSRRHSLNQSQIDAVAAALLGTTQEIADAVRLTGIDPQLLNMPVVIARLGTRLRRCPGCSRWITRRAWAQSIHGCPHCGASYHSHPEAD